MGRWWFVLAIALAAFGQQSEEPRIRANIRQVLVPIVVMDAKGHHATGLRAEDFTVSEDGVLQKVVSFSSEADAGVVATSLLAGRVAPVANGPTTAVRGRTYVICFDTLHSSFGNFARVRDAMVKLFQKEEGSGAQYVMVSLGRSVRVIQNATSDQKLLLSRIHEKSFLDVVRGVEAGIMAVQVNDTVLRMEQYCKRCPCGPSARSGACYPERQVLRQQINAQVEQTALIGGAFLDGLKGLMAELAKLPGGRTMILISDGFSLTPGEEFFAVASAYLPNYSEFRFVHQSLEPRLQETLAIAAKNDVRVYGVDSRGVALASYSGGGVNDASNSGTGDAARNRGGSMMSAMESKQNSIAFQNGAGMAQLAAATGGVYFHNSNDVLKDLRTAIADGREYYVLSYVPANAVQDGKFRKITVAVRDRSLVVRAKNGYWAEKE